ncbi:MAG TPA: hypothetical protein VKL40_01870 [Candidatus Angelobacter sp.]|nr:hypothetical protein [Candidatus Angelobacter sp.]
MTSFRAARPNRMRTLVLFLGITATAVAQQMPREDAIRVAEFFRLSAQIQDTLWPEWSKTPSPLLLVTADREFLTRSPAPPKGFTKVSEDLYTRARVFNPAFLATFPAFGPPAVIVVGEPQNTQARASTPWLITLMHEHFHQLQYGKPGYYEAVKALGLDRGDSSGMWILNYPFPYQQPEVVQGFAHLRDLLVAALNVSDDQQFKKAATDYVRERKKVFAQLSPDDRKYFSFQLWQEGIARYTQVKAAEAAAGYRPTEEFASLPDYLPFADYAPQARQETLAELKTADIAKMKRVFVYSFGAAEGLLLDRLNPGWKQTYFARPLSTDRLFLFEPETSDDLAEK